MTLHLLQVIAARSHFVSSDDRLPHLAEYLEGHSYILKVMRDEALALIHMNPGACGHPGWHLVRTVLRFSVETGKISEVQAIELCPRGRLVDSRREPLTC
jgi:hypothetical protein